MTTKIILTRHAHVEGIKPRRFRGRADVPLTQLGMTQAKVTAMRIAAAWQPIAVYSSPLKRCMRTATAIAEVCEASSGPLEALNDLDYGAWQWKTHAEITKDFHEEYEAWRTTPHRFRFPGGESLQDIVTRTAGALRLVLQRHRDETVVLVSHYSVNRALFIQILDQPLSAYWRLVFEPCGISEIDFTDDVPWVLRINETFHMAAIGEEAVLRPPGVLGRVIQ